MGTAAEVTRPGVVVRTAGAPNSYVIWKSSKNQDVAFEFLRAYCASYKDAFMAATFPRWRPNSPSSACTG